MGHPLLNLNLILFAIFSIASARVHRINDRINDQVVLGPEDDHPVRIMEAAPPHSATPLKKPTEKDKKWLVTQCSSTNSETDNGCDKAVDDNSTTWWQSKDTGGPHSITIDLREAKRVTALHMLPAKDGVAKGGLIAGHRVFLSADKDTWTHPAVAYGTWFDDPARTVSS